jgi:Cof subfamily protein (haloacid dehalogenase superfamily)
LSIIKELSLDSYHIFCDGALVSNPERGCEIYARPLDPDLVRQMVDFTRRHGMDLELFSDDRYFVERETWSTAAHRDFFGIEPTLTDFSRLWKEARIIKGGLVTTTPDEVARAHDFCRHFGESLHSSWARTPAYPGVNFINILAPGVSKGSALEALVPHLGISLGEVIAVGDGHNDISLLSSAGLAVAMDNAPDEVKAVADHITLDVEQSGLAAAINRFLLSD